ncbi:MAG: hypothetical protein K2N15_07165 [Lachnospiraceae bacterium]|nr:hypothetical protein [Lachnospiraceae bacterium]
MTSAFLITKQLDDFGIGKHETAVPIMRVPAIAFLYLLGKAEAEGQSVKLTCTLTITYLTLESVKLLAFIVKQCCSNHTFKHRISKCDI